MTSFRLPPDAPPAARRPDTDGDPQAFHQFMRTWATGITVVTSRRQGHSVGCTVTAFTSVSLHPPLLLISLSTGSRTLRTLRRRGVFGLNVLSGAQADLASHFATAPGDRFATVPHHLVDGVPLLDTALSTAVCQVERAWTVADHTLVLGRPSHYAARLHAAPLIRYDGTATPLPQIRPTADDAAPHQDRS
ncbi:flavin reductase family protein [Streptomyces sp. NPDC050658]|uniref:flavin reductase family protein n=1 Tax=unclassified Streptomyces TaxID=2593676 RepID=UPI00342E553C